MTAVQVLMKGAGNFSQSTAPLRSFSFERTFSSNPGLGSILTFLTFVISI